MHIASIDAGSSSMRVVLFSPEGVPLVQAQRGYAMERGPDGRAEMDPALFADTLCALLSCVARQAREQGLPIDALSLTSQRSSVIAVDQHGQALRPALMWHDTRAAGLAAALNQQAGDVIHACCGMSASPVFSAPKMLWLKQNEPHHYAAAHRLVGIHDFLLHSLTGAWQTDTSLASRTCLLDVTALDWSPALLDLFQIDPDKLCRLVPAGSMCGTLRPDMARQTGLAPDIPVVTAGGDQQCAALGMGAMAEGDVVINSGTGSYVIMPTDRPRIDPHRRLVCNVSAVPGQWIVEGGVLSAGLVFGWFNDLFYAGQSTEADLYASINADCEQSPPGARGLVASPCLNGRGAPHWDPAARGLFHNMSFQTRREDFARALLEGIAAELGECLAAVGELSGLERFASVICAGGLTRSAAFNQILSDTINTPVALSATSEATCTGAWLSAAVSLGLYADLASAVAAAGTRRQTCRFEPDPARHALYRRYADVRRHIYESVDMRRLHELLRSPS